MKKIATISLERMQNGMHFTYVSYMKRRIKADEVVREKVNAELRALEQAIAREAACNVIPKRSALTAHIAEADAERDVIFTSYKKIVMAYEKVAFAEYIASAEKLAAQIKGYNIDVRKKMDDESGVLLNFVAELEEDLMADVERLSLTTFVKRLKEANERVIALVSERTSKRANSGKGALKAARKATDKAYRALVGKVNALAVVEGDADYAAFIDLSNTVIRRYKHNMKRGRRTAKKAAAENDQPDTAAQGA